MNIHYVRNAFDFKGKANSSEYQSALYVTAFTLILLWFVGIAVNFTLLPVVFLGLNLIPSISVTTRRLRDAGLSLHYLWLFLIPLVGWVILIIRAFGAVSMEMKKPEVFHAADQNPNMIIRNTNGKIL